MKGFKVVVFGMAALILFGCAKKIPQEAPAVSMAQADSYFLYSFAVRDAKALNEKKVPDMAVRTDGNVTVYDFKDHVIKECGTHLTGSVTITDNGEEFAILASFPKVEKNPYEITSFKFDITEPKGKYRESKGRALVNKREYGIEDIIRVSRF